MVCERERERERERESFVVNNHKMQPLVHKIISNMITRKFSFLIALFLKETPLNHLKILQN